MLNNKPVLIILSLIISLSLWVYVTGQVDPDTKAKLNNIPVTITNEEDLAVSDLAVVQDENFTTSATIIGKRSYVNKAKSGGVTAYVDVSKAKKGINELDVEFETPAGVTVDTSSEALFTVKVEDRESKEVPVTVTFSDVAEGTVVPWARELYPVKVTASGAKSSLAKVEQVIATVNTQDVGEDAKNIEADLIAADAEGQKIQGIDLNRSSAVAVCQMLDLQEVPLKLKEKGLDSKYKVDSIIGPETVKVVSDADTLAKLDQVEGVVDLSDVKEGGIAFRKIEVQLPWNVYLYQEIEDNAKVTVKVAD